MHIELKSETVEGTPVDVAIYTHEGKYHVLVSKTGAFAPGMMMIVAHLVNSCGVPQTAEWYWAWKAQRHDSIEKAAAYRFTWIGSVPSSESSRMVPWPPEEIACLI